MATLPKHLTQIPSLVHADIGLTIDGGDVRGDAMQAIYAAIEEAIYAQCEKHGLDNAISRRLRSTDSRRLRRTLRARGFQVPLDPPQTPAAVDPVLSNSVEPSPRGKTSC